MSKATLDIRHSPTPDDRLIVVDCKHGSTTVALLNPDAAGLTETYGVEVALTRHDDAERCRYTRHLWRRYGRDAA